MAPFPKLNIFFSKPAEGLFRKNAAVFASACFFLLFLSNSLLSYGALPVNWKIWVVFLGILVPLSSSLFIFEKRDPFEIEALPGFPTWVWFFFGAVAVFLRFYRLSRFTPWPVTDEGLFGYFATLQGQHWDWRVLHDFRSTPLVYSWGLSLFFRLFGESLTTLWFFPALLSLACVPLLGWAGRRMFPRSLALMVLVWMAVGFWPIYMGRFSTQCIFLVFWECLTLLFLARYLSPLTHDAPHRRRALYLLALLTGLGFYTYLAWPFVALLVFLTVFFKAYPSQAEKFSGLFKFLAITAATVAPLLLEFARQYHGYFHHLWVLGTPHSLSYRLQLPMACLKDFFWGNPGSAFHFGPIWGGLLNPVLTSLTFFGLIDLARNFKNRKTPWVFTAFFILFLPAVLTNNFELMRLCAMPPLLVFFGAIGTQSFLARFPSGKRIFLFLALLVLSLSFDSYHLFVAYPRDWMKNPSAYKGNKSPEFYRAYSLLKPMAEREGPGLILLNFHPDPYDQTLFVATYGFNAAENPKLDPSNARWGALLANIHEQPFLSKIFHGGKWVWLSPDLRRRDGGYLLEMVPLDAGNRRVWNRWLAADLSLRELTRMIVQWGVDPDQRDMLAVLEKAYPLFKGDRLLESRYWRIMALHHQAGGNTDEAIRDYQKALSRGYPMAHLYNEMGCLCYQEGKRVDARAAFEKALRLRPDLTDAAENLRNLLLDECGKGAKKGFE